MSETPAPARRFYRQIFIDERSLGLSNRVRTAIHVEPCQLAREQLLFKLQALDGIFWEAFRPHAPQWAKPS